MSFTYVYVLQSERDGLFYVGMTGDLRRRFLQHQRGQNASTAERLPVRLIFYEAYPSESDARRRERYLKTTKGKATLRAMLSDHLTRRGRETQGIRF
jgi:putative endonuclease